MTRGNRPYTRPLFGRLAFIGAGAYLFNRGFDALLDRSVPPKGRFIDVGGSRLHVVDQGEGPAVLLLHGLMGSGANFAMGMTKALVASGHRVIAPDRAGYGYSGAGSKDLNDQAALMVDLLDALGIGSCVVCGHSLGGTIALRMAELAPERVQRLSLIAPALVRPRPVTRVNPAKAMRVVTPIVNTGSYVAIPALLPLYPLAAALAFFPEMPKAGLFRHGGGREALRGTHIRTAMAEISGLSALSDEIAQVPPAVPTDILTGDTDPIVPAETNALALAERFPDKVGVSLVKGAGHMVLAAQPQLCADHVAASSAKARSDTARVEAHSS